MLSPAEPFRQIEKGRTFQTSEGIHVRSGRGSVSIHIAKERPLDAPEANWLPVSNCRFNVMLRVYGSEGTVADQTYVPPGIRRNR